MANLRIKIKENLNLNLNLNADINYLSIKNKHKKDDFSQLNENNINKTIIFELIHKHSNYEDIMWNFWKQDKKSCIKEITNLLIEISKLDKMLTWDCKDVAVYYESNYDTKHKKSLLVETISNGSDLNEDAINIELPSELIKMSSADNLLMDVNDAMKLKSIIDEFKIEFNQLIESCNLSIDNDISYGNHVTKF